MIRYLASAAKAKREEAGLPQRAIAYPAEKDISRISQFEKGVKIPTDLEEILSGYVSALGIEERSLWEEALALWSADAAPGDAVRAARKAVSPRRPSSNATKPATQRRRSPKSK